MNYRPCSTHVVKGFLTKTECENIVNYVQTSVAQKAKVGAGVEEGKVKKKIRNCSLVWIPHDEHSSWLSTKIFNKMKEVNQEQYAFELEKLEQLQYLKYKPFNFFKPHFDVGPGNIELRKLTMSIQLSEPREYLGGGLSVASEHNTKNLKGIGDAIIFPTYLLHQAHPVWLGSRQCLVAWALGSKRFQ